jgi:hypothetical protein
MQVEFYLIDPVEVLHFAPVVRALAGMGVDAYFVLRRGDTSTVQLGLCSWVYILPTLTLQRH